MFGTLEYGNFVVPVDRLILKDSRITLEGTVKSGNHIPGDDTIEGIWRGWDGSIIFKFPCRGVIFREARRFHDIWVTVIQPIELKEDHGA